MIKSALALLLLTCMSFTDVQAYENRCSTHFTGAVKSLCKGRTIPASKTRNFYRRSQRLACTSNVDHYIRRPQKYDFVKWSKLRSAGYEQDAWDLRRALPSIEWDSLIPYQVVEVWQWEDCVLGTSGSECGYEQVCQNVRVPHTRCDDKGNCTTTYTTEQQCHDEPKTCWYDETQYERWHCSNEIMTYSAKFERPSANDWNLKKDKDKHADFIPNKYDLLPGEIEDVQVYNSRSNMSSVLNPEVKIGNAWNKYDLSDIRGDIGRACKQDTNYKISVTIRTIERDLSKNSPNAFDLPVNAKGKPLEPFEWHTEKLSDGRTVRVKPKKLRLMDKSSAVVKAVAENSRRNQQFETLKEKYKKNGNLDFTNVNEDLKGKHNSGFFENTEIRVRLVQDRWTLNRQLGFRVYSDEAESVIASTNVLSENQDIALSDLWAIDLMKAKLYLLGSVNDGRKYIMYASMYQKGVPFYRQSCWDNSSQSWCALHIAGHYITRYLPIPFGDDLNRGIENYYFSEEMSIPFSTDYGYDDRSFLQRLNELVDFNFDSLFHKRAPGVRWYQ